MLDNQVVFYNLEKTAFKTNFNANCLLVAAGDLCEETTLFTHFEWIPTELMSLCWADALSRVEIKQPFQFRGSWYGVTQWSHSTFKQFENFFRYVDLIQPYPPIPLAYLHIYTIVISI